MRPEGPVPTDDVHADGKGLVVAAVGPGVLCSGWTTPWADGAERSHTALRCESACTRSRQDRRLHAEPADHVLATKALPETPANAPHRFRPRPEIHRVPADAPSRMRKPIGAADRGHGSNSACS